MLKLCGAELDHKLLKIKLNIIEKIKDSKKRIIKVLFLLYLLNYMTMNVNKIRVTKKLLEAIDNDKRLIFKFPSKTVDKESLVLFHETNLENLKSIVKSGILLSNALEYNGDCIWASNKLEDKNNWMYGDFAVEFYIDPKSVSKANDTEYRVYSDIKPEQLLSIYAMTPRTEVGKEKILKELGLEEKELDFKEKMDYNKSISDLKEMVSKGNIKDGRIIKYIEECIDSIKNISFFPESESILNFEGLEFKEGDALKHFGTYMWPKNYNSEGELILNKYMFNESEEAIKNTILHELAHYIVFKWGTDLGVYYERNGQWWYDEHNMYYKQKSDWSSHGNKWKYVSDKISRATGNKITRTNTYDLHTEVGKRKEDNVKYILKCKNCGYEYKYHRMCDAVKHYDRVSPTTNKPWYYCTNCNAGHHSGDKPPFELIVKE